MTRVTLVIPSYQGDTAVDYTLTSLHRHDPQAWERLRPFTVITHDHSPYGDHEDWQRKYNAVGEKWRVPVNHLKAWSGLQGAYDAAFKDAIDRFAPEWQIAIGDDLAFTPGALSALLDFIETNDLSRIGILQPGFHNSHQLTAAGTTITEEEQSIGRTEMMFPGNSKLTEFFANHEWPLRVQRSAHYDNNGVCRNYCRPNGSIFACRSDIIKQCGGVNGQSHRIDELLGLQCWTQTDYGVITVPTPPVIHFFARASSSLARIVPHNAASEASWVHDTGESVSESDKRVRLAMGEWEARIENRNAMMNLKVPEPSPYCPTEEDRACWQSDFCDAREKGLTVGQVHQSHLDYWKAHGCEV